MTAPFSRRDFLQKALLTGAGWAATGAPSQGSETPADTPSPPKPLRIKTLGTGAADHDWKRLGSPGVRGSTSTLIDGHVLIDCGRTGSANLSRFNVAPQELTDLVITHSHADHFDIAEIGKVIEGRAPEAAPLAVWAAPQPLAALGRKLPGRFTGHALTPGARFGIGRLQLTALPANHLLSNPSEQALHFLIETPCGNLLYALDGAWMLKQARELIGKRRLSLIIWDATMSKTGDYRIFEHNDLAMIAMMMQSLQTTGAVDAKTVCVLDHTARTLWPEEPRQAESLAAERGWVLASDGMDLELR